MSKVRVPDRVVIYNGPSEIDGKPIVVIATGLKRKSQNAKTGDMVQAFIIRSDLSPIAAINDGSDESVCGNCPLRGILSRIRRKTVNRLRVCYVNVSQSVLSVWQAFTRGNYESLESIDIRSVFGGRRIRLGAYGDPAAVPYAVWSEILRVSDGHTGYTHQWRDRRFWRYRKLLMASVETESDMQLAQSMGWRTFRASPDTDLNPGEIHCPASSEGGMTRQCSTCMACNGTGTFSKTPPRKVSVSIKVHGSPSVLGSYRRTLLTEENA